MPETGITRREIEQHRAEFRDSAEGRWRAAAAGTGAFTPYYCGDCGAPLSLEEEGWVQCNACLADSESWGSGESESEAQTPQTEPATDRNGDQTRACGLVIEAVRSDHVTWRWCEISARFLGRSVSTSVGDIHL